MARDPAWPTSRLLATLGGVLGLLLAALLLGGSFAGGSGVGAGLAQAGFLLDTDLLGLMGAAHLGLSVLVLASATLTPRSRRNQGAVLVACGALGLFLGLGLWVGAVLALAGGVLAMLRAPARAWGRRPTV